MGFRVWNESVWNVVALAKEEFIFKERVGLARCDLPEPKQVREIVKGIRPNYSQLIRPA